MANAIYEDRYLLGTALARPLIAKTQIEVAKQEGANAVAHGATGKGNDQVRFELCYYALMPGVKVISPWKDKDFLSQFKGRTDLLKYASEKKIPVKVVNKDDGTVKDDPYEMFVYLNKIAGENGIGLLDMVENRFVGVKSR